MQDEIETWKVVGQSQTRADRVLIHQQLIVVPAETCADGPFAQADLILDEGRLLKVGLATHEGEGRRRIRIELAEIRDDVVEALVQKCGVRFHAGFPLVAAVMDGNAAFEVALAKIIVLEGDHGSG